MLNASVVLSTSSLNQKKKIKLKKRNLKNKNLFSENLLYHTQFHRTPQILVKCLLDSFCPVKRKELGIIMNWWKGIVGIQTLYWTLSLTYVWTQASIGIALALRWLAKSIRRLLSLIREKTKFCIKWELQLNRRKPCFQTCLSRMVWLNNLSLLETTANLGLRAKILIMIALTQMWLGIAD